jgi:hypothetical protein
MIILSEIILTAGVLLLFPYSVFKKEKAATACVVDPVCKMKIKKRNRIPAGTKAKIFF